MTAVQPLIELAGFDGAVECRLAPGAAVNLTLRGRERGGGTLEALLAGVRLEAAGAGSGAEMLGALPASLDEVRLLELPGPAASTAATDGPRRLQLRSRERRLDLVARSLQLHRDAGPSFFAAVPPVSVPAGRRLGWALLLALLRVPATARLIAALQGRR